MNQPFSLTHSTHEEKVTTAELNKEILFPPHSLSPPKGGIYANIMIAKIYIAFPQRGKGGGGNFLMIHIFISLKT